jgi:hypothetical protein
MRQRNAFAASVLNSQAGGLTARFAPVIPLEPDPKFTAHLSITLLDVKMNVLGFVCVEPTKYAKHFCRAPATDEIRS